MTFEFWQLWNNQQNDYDFYSFDLGEGDFFVGDIERWFKHTDIAALLDWQTEIWLNMTFDWNTSIRNYPGDWLTYSILILYIYIVYVYISTV